MQELDRIKQEFSEIAGGPVPTPPVPFAFTVKSQAQRDRANELWLKTQASLKVNATKIKQAKDDSKAALERTLAPILVDDQLLKVMDGTLERAILAYDDEQERLAKAENDRQKALFDKRMATAEKKAEQTGELPVVRPPAYVPPPVKTQAVEGVGSSTRIPVYKYSIPGCADPSKLRLNEEPAKKMMPRYFYFDPPELPADHPDVAEIAKAHPEWFGLDKASINRDVKASRGEQTVPGVLITEEKTLAARTA